MKILMATPYFYPKIGGLENYAYMAAKGLKQRGHEVVVVTSNHEHPNRRDEQKLDGIRVIYLPFSKIISNTPFHPLWYWWIKNIIKLEKPDVINAHSPVPYIADMAFMARKRTPFVITYHAGSLKKGRFFIDSLLHVYEHVFLKHMFKQADEVISVYPTFVNNLINTSRYVNFIPPAVDTTVFKPELKTQHTDNFRLLYVGRIERSSSWKGIKTLVSAMAHIIDGNPHVTLELVGSGDAVDEYKALASALGIQKNVNFVGALRGKALVDAYRNADCLVLPSETDAESFGMVLIEAMACGVPVIASKIGGMRNVVIDGQNGLFFKPADSLDLATKIAHLARDKKRCLALGKNGRVYVEENFSKDRLLHDTEAVLTNAQLLRVSILSEEYPPHVEGGLGVHYYELVKELSKYCKVTLYSSRLNRAAPHLDIDKNITVIRTWTSSVFPFAHIIYMLIASTRAYFDRSDLTHICSPYGFLYLVLPKHRKVVVKMHTTYSSLGGTFFYRNFLFPLGSFIDTFHIKRADKIITISDYMRKEITERLHADTNKIEVILNGLDIAKFSPAQHTQNIALKEQLGLQQFDTIVLCVGRIVERKGTLNVLKAAEDVVQQYPKTCFVFIGSGFNEGGSYTQYFKDMLGAESLRHNVRHIEWTDRDELLHYYQASDVLVHAAFFEPFGNVVAEAMSCGLAAVISPCGGPQEIVGRDGGIIMSDNEPVTISKTLNELLSSPQLLDGYKHKALRQVQTLSWNNNAKMTVDLYRSLIDKGDNQ